MRAEAARVLFDSVRVEVLDAVRSAERALDAGESARALARFRPAGDLLPDSPSTVGGLTESDRELLVRVDPGLASAGLQGLRSALRTSLTALERGIVASSVPALGSADVEVIDDDTPPDDSARRRHAETITSLPAPR